MIGSHGATLDNLGHRAMNPIEQALALGSLSDHYSRAEIISNFLPLLGCQPHAEKRKQKFEVRFDSPEQLSAALKQITSACESGQIRAIFKTMEE
ncbi:MAG: hypothetical protein NTY46_05215 [Candidatus Sumerlaeota bacterium]|nr:hypothetical protein [Candidatus Sumerlaeota bacterium]